MEIAKLNGHSITRWVGTEMALSDGDAENGPVLWEHSTVPYLQLISIDLQLSDGSVFRMDSQSDDGSGYYGLCLSDRDVIDTPSIAESGTIFRTRHLTELPIGVATVVVSEVDGPNAILRIEIVIDGHTISFWAAEVYERDGGKFDIVGRDESILVQVDGARPRRSLDEVD